MHFRADKSSRLGLLHSAEDGRRRHGRDRQQALRRRPHTNRFLCITRNSSAEIVHAGHGTVCLEPDVCYLVNVGSVGQPHDGDPGSSFVIFDEKKDTVEFGRAEYDVESKAAKIIATGLPRCLAGRLKIGQ